MLAHLLITCMLFTAKVPAAALAYPQDRTIIKAHIQQKIAANKPLVVHVMVPLCDNENQGIVPTTPSLGNGLSTKSNLYWATSKGIKRYFKDHKHWKMLATLKDPSKHILERAVFERSYGKTRVILVADAYRGDRMQACLNDYFDALAGRKKERLQVDSTTIYDIASGADLIAFNGHNGLMDENVSVEPVSGNTPKDAVVIACASQGYFSPVFKKVNAYPLVTTTNLLYPGAPVLAHIIDAWAQQKPASEIHLAAGAGYYEMKPKSGVNGSRRLFATGW